MSQLGRDLETVLQVMVPRGPVILVGHSMGGMTVLSHARQFPGKYGKRIVGAALISSAAEGLPRSPLGEILQNPALEAVRFAARYAPEAGAPHPGAARSVLRPILRTASYGDDHVSPSVVAFTENMIHDTPIATLVEFLHALEVHDESARAAGAGRDSDDDRLRRPRRADPGHPLREMAAVLPDSELVVVPGAGHLVQLEAPQVINDALVRLVERATPSKLVALTRRWKARTRHA